MSGEAIRAERRWEALWSYRANPPTVGEGATRTVVPLSTFLDQIGLGDDVTRQGPKPPEVSDDEMRRMMAAGKMGLVI